MTLKSWWCILRYPREDFGASANADRAGGPTDLSRSASQPEALIPSVEALTGQLKFLETAARYFETRTTGGEDGAHWSNVFNARNCRRIARTLEALAASQGIVTEWPRPKGSGRSLTSPVGEAEAPDAIGPTCREWRA